MFALPVNVHQIWWKKISIVFSQTHRFTGKCWLAPCVLPHGSTKRTHPDRSDACTYFGKIELFSADFALSHIGKKSVFFSKTLRRCKKKPSADVKIMPSASTNIQVSNKKDLNEKCPLNSEKDGFLNALAEFRWNTLAGVFHQNAKNRSFFELRGDFWFKSFLLDHKNILIYENVWFLVITRHCSS